MPPRDRIARDWPDRIRSAATGLLVLLMLTTTASAVPGSQAATPLARVIALVDTGDFAAARAAIDAALAARTGATANDADDYAFQRERMRRILLDFTLTEREVRDRVRKEIPDLRDAEFDGWNAAGLFEHQVIDGRTLYFKRSPSNLFRLSAQARARRDPALPPITDGPMESFNPHHRAIRAAAERQRRSSVLPQRVRMTQTLTVDADAVPAGETIAAWIPYPRAIPGQQEDIRTVASEPAARVVAPVSALQRTVSLRRKAEAGKPTRFSVTYELTIFAQDHAIDPARVVATRITPALAPYIAERAPHVVFTDAMRAFSRKVVGDETNPYRITRKLFAAVDAIPWAGAREYSTISNIGDYALHAGHADCGQQTLLLITLLRLNGIPARWQSGMVFSDGDYDNIHDWGQVYLAPYGWVPIDVTTGRLKPGPGDDSSLAWFYLGGLDHWRIAFNDDWSQPFQPPKRTYRSDDVDSQRGEVEWRGGNLYFDKWNYDFAWTVLPMEQANAER